MSTQENHPESTRPLTVQADMVHGTSPENLSYADRTVAGSYPFEVPQHLTDEEAAACALGFFQATVPVKYVADFELKVFDAHGKELKPDYGLDWYEFSERYRHLRPRNPYETRLAELLELMQQQKSVPSYSTALAEKSKSASTQQDAQRHNTAPHSTG